MAERLRQAGIKFTEVSPAQFNEHFPDKRPEDVRLMTLDATGRHILRILPAEVVSAILSDPKDVIDGSSPEPEAQPNPDSVPGS
jgi:hypothetical protein